MQLGLINKWNAAHAAEKAKPKPAPKPKPAKAQRAPAPPKQPVFVAASPTIVNHGGGGVPMPMPVRSTIEKSLQVDLGAVRVHTDTSAHTANKNLSARAFTYGNDIFLGKGESPANVGLIAHEAAHVVQQRGAPKVQRWSSRNGSDSCEHEAHRASAAVLSGQTFSVNERTTGAKVQRFGISDLVDYFADKANNIPGYRMFTLIIGVNPINMETVERTPANIFRAAIELIPGGKLITDVLEKHGLLEKGANWVATQFKKLAMVGEAFIKAIEDFIDDLGWSDLLHPFRLWERAKRIVLDPVEKIIDFVVGLVDGIIELIKKAILIPLAKLAEGTAGWDLLCAVLGKNPITGDPVPRTAETLIGGFMKLIHQEEIWENIKKANALSKAWAWFNNAVDGLIGFVKEIPSLFIQALKDLELVDILVLPKAFVKIGKVFLGFLGRFLSWAGEQVWSLLEIIFSVVAPSIMPYLKKAAAAFRSILKNPIGFVSNLVKAGKQGFQQFASNFLNHLKAALIGWLTGTLEGANIYIPQGLSFMEIVKFVLSVLGLTWQNIRQKLVKVIGETAVKALETGFDLVKTLITQGPAAAWEQIQKGISNLKEMVMDGITSYVKSRIVNAAVTKLAMMLNPASAFIQAIIAIYNTIMFFIERLRQIGQVVAAFIDSISAIANGIIGAAANKVEMTMERLLVVVISFLARFAGLGNVGEAVQGIIKKIRDPIDKALDKVVDWIVTMAKKGFAKLFGKKDKPDNRTDEQKKADLDRAVTEAEALQANQEVSDDQVKKGLQAIKQKYNMTSLELVVDSEDESKETVHVEGEINPGKSGKKGDRKKDGKTAAFTLSRPSFVSETLEILKTEYPEDHRKTRGDPILKKGLARRHIVSSKDMAEHYESTLKGTLWSQAKSLLETKGSGDALITVKDPLGNKNIHAGAKERHSNFFNYTKNLFVGDRFRNSAIGRALDPEKPGMGAVKLAQHIASIKKMWALDSSFTPTPPIDE
jgi:hypothetical protein